MYGGGGSNNRVCLACGVVQEAQIKSLREELDGKQRDFKQYCERFEERIAQLEGTLRAEWAASEEER